MGEKQLPLGEDQLPNLHEGEKPFFAGDHDAHKYGFDYDKDVVSEESASFKPFSHTEAAHLSAKLALPSADTINLTENEPKPPKKD